MSTKLSICGLTSEEIARNYQRDNGAYLELGEGFLQEIITNKGFLLTCLSAQELELIRPNWGVIELRRTDVLKDDKREQYLALLQETIKTNSSKNLDQFLYDNGIISASLADRAKSPKAIIRIIEKVYKAVQEEPTLRHRFHFAFQAYLDFLSDRIDKSEKVLIEFVD